MTTSAALSPPNRLAKPRNDDIRYFGKDTP